MKETPDISIEDAGSSVDPVAAIWEMKSQASVMGANDYERGAFDEIIKDFNAGKIVREDAVKKARKILDDKQDYH